MAVQALPKEAETCQSDEEQARVAAGRLDLAVAFRWAARLGYHEAVANHFSLAVSDDGSRFLVNPYARHFARLKATDLLLLDSERDADMAASYVVDPTAWYIHARIHRALPQARCLMHSHTKYATALSCLQDMAMPPIDQNTMRFYGRIAFDSAFEGMAMDDAEGDRLAGLMGDKTVLMMGNHGVMVMGPTVARAFDDLYYFEKACETLVTAYSTGRPLRVCSDDVAAQTRRDWGSYSDTSDRHFAELRAILDVEEPDYKD